MNNMKDTMNEINICKKSERIYNVKEVAQILNVNQETVRRWIRNNKLEATIESKKKGHMVTEEALLNFKAPKELALSMLSATKDILELQTKKSDVLMEKMEEAQRMYEEAYKKAVDVNIRKIEGEIKEREEAIRIKQACIEQLKKEIERDRNEIIGFQKRIIGLKKE